MENDPIRQEPVDKWILDPLKKFIDSSTTSGIVLFSAAILAIVISNTPWAEDFNGLWKIQISLGVGEWGVKRDIHHFINDGLMAIFFFIVGLELKRELIAGKLNSLRKALLPVAASLGGMVVPALIYLAFNIKNGEPSGWGVPVATDIAFALGVLFLLGDRVPPALKVFLTTLAIVDDIGAVLIIAFNYTSGINPTYLAIGGGFFILMVVSNLLGARNTLWYAILGIGGLWLCFLLAGVHSTIAGVLAAFTIPAGSKIPEGTYHKKLHGKLDEFLETSSINSRIVTNEQLHILSEVRDLSKKALTPLQQLEYQMSPVASYIILPLFALANTGIKFTPELFSGLFSPVTTGVFAGLLAGKFLGITGFVLILHKFKLARLPENLSMLHIAGCSLLAAIGFTMSLFIAGLAFSEEQLLQAKMGVLTASLIAGVLGYLVIRKATGKKKAVPEERP